MLSEVRVWKGAEASWRTSFGKSDCITILKMQNNLINTAFVFPYCIADGKELYCAESDLRVFKDQMV